MLLVFDAYLAWYYPFKKSVPFLCDTMQREARAFDNMCKAIDLNEIVERASMRSHGSFLFHGAIYKSTRDILLVGDIWAVDLSPLELQNAETKRVAEDGGSKHITFTTIAVPKRAPALKMVEGPTQLVQSKGYRGSMATSRQH